MILRVFENETPKDLLNRTFYPNNYCAMQQHPQEFVEFLYFVFKITPMKKILLFLTMVIALGSCQTIEKSPPNIIFILSDDHALKAISAYDSSLISTPNIDRLANEGMMFNHCFCANSICAPSRATILTGKYSHMNGVRDNGNSFDGSQVTFPKILRENGYQTALIGKWHLKSEPTGFDYWEVLPGQGDYYNPYFIQGRDTVQYEGYVTKIITRKSLDWLKQRDLGKPFLLLVNHKAPHRNWMPEPEKIRKYSKKVFPEPTSLFENYAGSIPRSAQEMSIARHMIMDYDLKVPSEALLFNDEEMEPSQKGWWEWEYGKMTEKQQLVWDSAMNYRIDEYREGNYTGKDLAAWKYQQYLRDYLGCIESVDESVGQILEYLDDNNLTNNTIIIYSSDQGFYLGEHGWYDKRWMYEESLHMPLLISYPGEIKSGIVTDELVQNIDFAPTLLDIAGIPVPGEMQGKSLISILSGDLEKPFRNEIYYHYYEYPGVHMVQKHNGIRTERYKLIHFYEQDIWELYDLESDPMEINNIANDPTKQLLLDSLKERLTALQEEVEDL
jgi:arylsulfatase A-like enzyme